MRRIQTPIDETYSEKNIKIEDISSIDMKNLNSGWRSDNSVEKRKSDENRQNLAVDSRHIRDKKGVEFEPVVAKKIKVKNNPSSKEELPEVTDIKMEDENISSVAEKKVETFCQFEERSNILEEKKFATLPEMGCISVGEIKIEDFVCKKESEENGFDIESDKEISSAKIKYEAMSDDDMSSGEENSSAVSKWSKEMNNMNSSPRKIKRVHFQNSENRQTNPQISNNVLFEKLNEVLEATKNIQSQINVLQGQMRCVAEALAENKVLATKCLRQSRDDDSLADIFPIRSEEDLAQFDNRIRPDNKKQYIKVMRSILEPAGVQKNLRRILGDDVIMAYNVDGVQGKKSFKEHNNFFSVLSEAVSMTNINSVGPADEHIRKAIQMQKRRIFKNMSLERKAERKNDI